MQLLSEVVGRKRRAWCWLAAVLLATAGTLVAVPGPANGSGVTITLNAKTTPLSIYELSPVEAPPSGELHATTTVSAVINGCPPAGSTSAT